MLKLASDRGQPLQLEQLGNVEGNPIHHEGIHLLTQQDAQSDPSSSTAQSTRSSSSAYQK